MDRPTPSSTLLKRKQTAARLNCSVETVKNLERDGTLMAVRLRASKNSQVFNHEHEVEALAAKGVV
jgi:hypothetical protein